MSSTYAPPHDLDVEDTFAPTLEAIAERGASGAFRQMSDDIRAIVGSAAEPDLVLKLARSLAFGRQTAWAAFHRALTTALDDTRHDAHGAPASRLKAFLTENGDLALDQASA